MFCKLQMGNIVTIFAYKTIGNDCFLQKWCYNALIMKQMFGSNVVLFTNRPSHVRQICPTTVHLCAHIQ